MTGRDTSVRHRCAISGIGLVTPLGHSAWETIRALLEGRRTADRLGEMPEEVDPLVLAKATGGSAFSTFSATDPAVDLAERAAREALTDAGVEAARDVRMIAASSKGAVTGLFDDASSERRAETIALSPHGYLSWHLRSRLGAGDTSSVVAACCTSIAALHQARLEIESGERERVLVVGVESAMLAAFVHSYKRLGVLAPMAPASAYYGRPLDAERCGFTLNECAAAVLLERDGEARQTHGMLCGTALATQPFDLVRAAGAFDALTRVIRRAAPGDERIALVQPHATGTADNDERELRAIEAALGDRCAGTPVYASKGAVGHGLGAAGLVNVVLSCLMGRVRKTAPMGWIATPVESRMEIAPAGSDVTGGLHVITAAGFGGHVGCAAVEI